MSAKTNHTVLVYYHFPQFLDRYKNLLEKARQDQNFLICKNRDQIEKNIEKADIIFSGSSFPVDILPKAKNLKWIQSMSAGVENFTRSKLIPQDVVLTKPKGIFGQLMAEYVMTYIFAVIQNTRTIFENQKKKSWQPLLGDSIRKKTIGIMGLGSVGSHIAYQLHLSGAEVIGLDEQERTLPYVTREYKGKEMNEFLEMSDFVVLTLPLTDSTEGMMGLDQFKSMKDSAYLINISRGPLVQEDALIKALQKGLIAGAVLDVFEEEPLPEDHPFWTLKNIIITPHISGPSLPEDLVQIFLENLRRWEEGRHLAGVVDLRKGY